MRLRILFGLGVASLAVTYMVIHYVMLPTAASLPTMVFQAYTNSPSGESCAVVAVTNNDSCSYTFRERFEAIIDKTNVWYVIQSNLANQTLKPNSSSMGIIQVPPHSAKWVVISVVTRHTFIERNFGWMFQTNKFDEVMESKWFP